MFVTEKNTFIIKSLSKLFCASFIFVVLFPLWFSIILISFYTTFWYLDANIAELAQPCSWRSVLWEALERRDL